MIYAVQAVDGGPVKIGYAVDPNRRLVSLQCGSPVKLRIVGVIAGGRNEEARLHRRFADARLHGEWFAATDELLSVFDASLGGVSPARFAEVRLGPLTEIEQRTLDVVAGSSMSSVDVAVQIARAVPATLGILRRLRGMGRVVSQRVGPPAYAKSYWTAHRTAHAAQGSP